MIRYHIDEVMYFRYPAAGGETHGLRVRGWAFDGDSDRALDYTGQFNDGEKNDIMPVRFPRIDVTSRLDNAENAGDCGFIARVDCPSDEVPDKFVLEASNGTESKVIMTVRRDVLEQICLRQPVVFKVESGSIVDGDIQLEGWAFSLDGEDVGFEVTGLGGRKISSMLDRFNKTKLYKLGFVGERNNFAGFRIRFPSNRIDHYRVRMFTENGGEIYGCSRKSVVQMQAEQEPVSPAADYDSWIRGKIETRQEAETTSDDAGIVNADPSKFSEDYLLITQSGDVLTDDAQKIFAEAAAANPEADVLYPDEDRFNPAEDKYCDPWFKPDYDPDLLRSFNYIGTTFYVRKTMACGIAEETGIDPGDLSGRPYKLLLRITEKNGSFCHVPQVLVHVRSNQPVVAAAGGKELKEHFARLGIDAKTEPNPYAKGTFNIIYPLTEEPLVSVIIPNKDHNDELDVCLKSLFKVSDYRNLEVIVIENNSTDPKTFDYYAKISHRYECVRVIRSEVKGFNYAAVNNEAAREANGDYLLFLNNDTKIISKGGIREMAANCARSGVGAVGAKLLYPDKTIQHAGILLGFAGFCKHNHRLEPAHTDRFHHYVDLQRSVSAVTGACMMVERRIFEQVGGFDEEFAVSCNDIDLCLKITETGNRILYLPTVQLWHYESKSRGREDTRAKAERFEYEKSLLITRWEASFRRGDPFYNPNLALFGKEYELKGDRDDEMLDYSIEEKKEFING